MSVIDSYSFTNITEGVTLIGGETTKVGQSITGDGQTLLGTGGIVFWCKKVNSPDGSVYGSLYAFDTETNLPTGTALTISNGNLASGINYALWDATSFRWDNDYVYKLEDGVKYLVTLEYDGVTTFGSVLVGVDTSTPTHSGSYYQYADGAWSEVSTQDCAFSIVGTRILEAGDKHGLPAFKKA